MIQRTLEQWVQTALQDRSLVFGYCMDYSCIVVSLSELPMPIDITCERQILEIRLHADVPVADDVLNVVLWVEMFRELEPSDRDEADLFGRHFDRFNRALVDLYNTRLISGEAAVVGAG